MADSPVKKHYDYAQQVVDEQAILDKYNAATAAQFNVQREQNRQAENQFYNQMYNTQKTAMDTIRQSNAAAVANGASRGVQAANELSALLGLQQESVQSATEIAQANRQTAQEETAAVLENVLKAYQQAQQERSQLVTQSIEAQSLEATERQAAAAEQNAQTERNKYLMDLKVNDPDAYYQEIAKDNAATDFTNMSDKQYALNAQNLLNATNEVVADMGFNWWRWNFIVGGNGYAEEAVAKIADPLTNLYTAYGLTADDAAEDLKVFREYLVPELEKMDATTDNGVSERARNKIAELISTRYKNKYTAAHKQK